MTLQLLKFYSNEVAGNSYGLFAKSLSNSSTLSQHSSSLEGRWGVTLSFHAAIIIHHACPFRLDLLGDGSRRVGRLAQEEEGARTDPRQKWKQFTASSGREGQPFVPAIEKSWAARQEEFTRGLTHRA